MNWNVAIKDIVIFGVAGALLGLVAGLILGAIDVVDSPFSLVIVGMLGGVSTACAVRYQRWNEPGQ